jgi:hypothetical protein
MCFVLEDVKLKLIWRKLQRQGISFDMFHSNPSLPNVIFSRVNIELFDFDIQVYINQFFLISILITEFIQPFSHLLVIKLEFGLFDCFLKQMIWLIHLVYKGIQIRCHNIWFIFVSRIKMRKRNSTKTVLCQIAWPYHLIAR